MQQKYNTCLIRVKVPRKYLKNLTYQLKQFTTLKIQVLKVDVKVKYTTEKAKEVKRLYSKGIPAKKISENLKIPLRTVYLLIKR